MISLNARLNVELMRNFLPPEVKKENSKIKIKRIFKVSSTHPHLDGHFDGFPIFPGVSQIQLLKKTLAEVLNVEAVEIIQIEKCKFTAMVAPNTELNILMECQEPTIHHNETNTASINSPKENYSCSWNIIGSNNQSFSKGTFFYELQ